MQLRPNRPAATADDDPDQPKRPRRRRTWRQRLLIVANVAVAMLALISAGALTFYNRQLSDISRIVLEGTLTPVASAGEPQNFLLVGTDNAEGLAIDDPILRGNRPVTERLTDAVMILRIDPNDQKAWLLSLPRDLYIPIAGNHGKDRINTVYALGGPELLIQTIQEDFGIPIHHFMEVNFLGFRQLVDAVGGVNIYFNRPARDEATGLYVPEAGCQHLSGEEALSFARSRHYTANIDGQWVEDPTSDHGRIARQQYFIKQAMKQAIAQGARNPIQASNMIGVAQTHVKIDQTLTPEQVLDLGSRFNNFNPDDLLVYEPYTTDGYAGEAAVLFLQEKPSQEMFNIFRGVNPMFNALAATRLEVRNGTGKSGEAEVMATEIKRRGFTVTGVSDDRNFRNDRSIIRYAPGVDNLKAAVLVARYLEVTPLFEEEPDLADSDHYVALVIGRDFTGVRVDPRPLEDFAGVIPLPADAASTIVPDPGATIPTDTAPPPDPQRGAFVPEPPEGVDC